MASGIYAKAYLIILALFTIVPLSRGNLTHGEPLSSSLGSTQYSGRLLVSVDVISNVGRPGVLLYNLESEAVITMKYSLNCSSYDTVYTIVAITSARHVAVITSHATFNISCATSVHTHVSVERDQNDDSSMPDEARAGMSITDGPLDVRVVEGEINMTVKAHAIGRAFLILMAHKVSDRIPSELNENHSRDGHLSSFSSNGGLSLYTVHSLTSNSSNSKGTITITEAKTEGQNMHEQTTNVIGRAMIIVMQLPRTFDEIFRIVLYVVIVVATVGMGVKVDFVVIKNVLKRPTAPIIGLCCQYICMPVIAYTVAKIIPQESPAVSLGIFTCGIAPGGGPSNMFTYLLGGDLTLSVTMTTLSSIAALGLLPLWLFTLGDTFKDDTVEMHVPYEKILEALAVAILPLFVGMFIKYKAPKVAKIISKILKPVLIIIVTFIISFGVYTNFYIFKMIRPMTIVAGCLLPYFGYLVGGVVAFLCCRTWTHIKTIAIETGIQNTAIAFLILFLSLPPPDNQLASVGPASSAIMTPLPLFFAVFIYTIYQRYTKKSKLQSTDTADLKLQSTDTADLKLQSTDTADLKLQSTDTADLKLQSTDTADLKLQSTDTADLKLQSTDTADGENGNIQIEKGQVALDISRHEVEQPLIILLWRKLSGHRPVKDLSNGTIKEMDTMLSKKEALARN